MFGGAAADEVAFSCIHAKLVMESISQDFAKFLKVFEVFRCFLAAMAPNMHQTKYRGARDPRAHKF